MMQNCAINGPLLFGFHTIEFSLKLCYEDFQEVFNTLKQKRCRFYRTNREMEPSEFWESDVFSDKGIRTCLKRFNRSTPEKEFPYFSLSFIVNPRIALGDKDYIGIFEITPQNVRLLFKVLNECIDALGLHWYYSPKYKRELCCTINEFIIVRLDLCVNCWFPSDHMASCYLKLMKRGNRFKFLREKQVYSETSKRFVHYENAVALKARSFSISIYNKKAQMLDNISFFKDIPPEAEGLLRFEMQLEREKVRRMIAKTGTPVGHSDLLLAARRVCWDEFSRYTKGLFGVGNYYTLDQAKALIMKNEKEKHQKKELKFLLAVSENRSLEKTIVQYGEKGVSILAHLERMGINPVTIPNRWKIDSLPYWESVPHLLGFI